MYFDLFLAAEAKAHTRLGSRLNYEQTGMSSLFRQAGRKIDDLGKDYQKEFRAIDPAWGEGALWFDLMSGDASAPRAQMVASTEAHRVGVIIDKPIKPANAFAPAQSIATLLPLTARAYSDMADFMVFEDEEVVAEENPWVSIYAALARDLETADVSGYTGPQADLLKATADAGITPVVFKTAFGEMDEDWVDAETWRTIQTHARKVTPGYFLNAIDMQLTPDGAVSQPEDRQILITLFERTLFMSLMIMGSCILLGYPIAWLLANLPMRQANLLLILVLLPFWTSLLVRTSAWKVLLQQQGVINDILVWLGMISDDGRLVMINNQFGTIVAMTHILLPFMILPMYSVMQTIPPTYLRAAKSLGATNWTAFWRVYFPQTIPGIGAGSILVFILAIGYYITPEIVGGTKGVFISNRIAYHISSSLNWGLAAALGTILLAVVLLLYWCYDKIVGIDNVKLG
jgi:putative spermidine/putrescine transport system permease protein